MMRSGARLVLAAVLMTSTGILLNVRGRYEVFPPRIALKAFPQQLGPWSTTRDIPIDTRVLEVLGSGDFLLRVYNSAVEDDPVVELFIAYFPSQRTGDTIHSPQHCLPGAGWTPTTKRQVSLALPGHEPFPANLYVVSKENARRLVLYWFWAHDRGVASEYQAKYYLIADAIKLRRSDGALVRMMIDMEPGETAEAAQRRVLPFATQVVPLLGNYIPR